MNLELDRVVFAPRSTLGVLKVDGRLECYTLEDLVRPLGAPKVPRETAIPAGKYEVVITRSERFSKAAGHDVFMPLLLKVPGFEGIRIHAGNAHVDTEGCLLVGQAAAIAPDGANVLIERSRLAYDSLFAKLQRAQGQIWITVS